MKHLYQTLIDKKDRQKSVAVLVDPDKYDEGMLQEVVQISNSSGVTFFLVGGSLLSKSVNDKVQTIKRLTNIPVFLFPGNLLQLCDNADGILFLSLISGRNPEYLIGNHVHAAPFLRNSMLEVIPTGYILLDTGATTSVEYISNTLPIPSDKPEIAVATAMAGEMLGLKLIYLEGGSGAQNIINTNIISEVKSNISVPLIVGGGIKTKQQAQSIFEAGADVIVIGNAIETKPGLLHEIAEIII
jgi:putative glycerol-1-phosphate prenyltransferase